MSLNKALIAELKIESTSTKKLLEIVPAEKSDWAPHEKSMKLGRLATHIAEIPIWVERIVNADGFDFGGKFTPNVAESNEALLKIFTEKQDAAIEILEAATDEKLNEPWTIKRGGQVIAQLPKKVALRNIAFNHLYHHRGQLSVYLRLLDIPIPGMYGPSADMPN
ncbi:MAG: damage-inducible protein DinB [Bacteroidetes bacterium]|nr:damage-inducible protein DinB [Bacteroidota bacterium]